MSYNNYHQEYKPTVNERTYQEVEYLKKNLGPILVAALAEICIRRPADPIEYLGHWLLRWRYNEELKRRDIQNALEVVRQKQWAQAQQEAAALHEPQPSGVGNMEYGSGVIPISENHLDHELSGEEGAEMYEAHEHEQHEQHGHEQHGHEQHGHEHHEHQHLGDVGPYDIVAEPDQEVVENEFSHPPDESQQPIVDEFGHHKSIAEGHQEHQHEHSGSPKDSTRRVSGAKAPGEDEQRQSVAAEHHSAEAHHVAGEPRKTSIGQPPHHDEHAGQPHHDEHAHNGQHTASVGQPPNGEPRKSSIGHQPTNDETRRSSIGKVPKVPSDEPRRSSIGQVPKTPSDEPRKSSTGQLPKHPSGEPRKASTGHEEQHRKTSGAKAAAPPVEE